MKRSLMAVAGALTALSLGGCGIASEEPVSAQDVESALTGQTGDIAEQMQQWESGEHRVPDRADCDPEEGTQFTCVAVIELSAVSEETLEVVVQTQDGRTELIVTPTEEDFTWLSEEGSGGLLESHGTRMFGGDIDARLVLELDPNE